MALTTINYKFNGSEEARTLVPMVEQKLQGLGKLIGGDAVCEVEFEALTSHQGGPQYRVEFMVTAAGALYRAEATEDNFLKAIDKARDELDSELSRAKDKMDTLRKRAGRMLKGLLSRG